MKKTTSYTLAVLTGLALMTACSKENGIDETIGKNQSPKELPSAPGQDEEKPAGATLIKVIIPDASAKVSMTQDGENANGSVLLAWEGTDQIQVIDADDASNCKTFTIREGYTAHEATFAGDAVTAESYNILYGAASVADADAMEYASQTQSGNASTAHLQYVALLEGVDSYEEVKFTDEWAAAHGGALRQSGVLRLRIRLPEGVTSVSKCILTAPSAIFYTSNAGTGTTDQLEVSFDGNAAIGSDRVLTVFAALPWKEAAVADASTFEVTVETPEQDFYHRDFTTAAASTLACGAVNSFRIDHETKAFTLDDFAGGKGIEGSPYLIANTRQMMNVKANMSDDITTYFKMIDNVDMDGQTWDYLNTGDGYKQLINFDGNNKTISNLSNSLFYVFKGSIQDLTLSGCNVGNRRGIFAEYCQGSGHTITNVDITNSSMSTTSTNSGALIGRINNGTSGEISVTITGCDLSDITVTGPGCTGGVIGRIDNIIDISDCTFSGSVTASGQYSGGFAAYTGDVAAIFTNCRVTSGTVKTTQNTDSRIGGFIGLNNNSCVIKGCQVGTETSKVTVRTDKDAAEGKVLNQGGFAGCNYGTITLNGSVRSKAYVNVTSANTKGQQINVGGFVGYNTGTVEYCDAIVDMSTMKGQYIGGFAGILTEGGSIEHGTVQGDSDDTYDILGNNYTGGFIGYMSNATSTATSSASDNKVLPGTKVNGQSTIGGFIGCMENGTLTDNTSAAAVTSRGTHAGGFVGAIEEGTVTRCSFTGTLGKSDSNTSNAYGGFAGYAVNATLDGCFSTGNVNLDNTKTEYVGGFIAHVKPSSDQVVNIRNCYVEGNVNSKNTGRWTGGFIGYIYHETPGTVTIENCHYSGTVTASGNYSGGFIGRILMTTSVSAERCYSSGSLSSTGQYLGGFVGDVDGAGGNISFRDCYTTVSLNTETSRYRGGFIAALQKNPASITISRCYTANAVTGTFEIGGMIGRTNAANFTIEDCAAWNTLVSASSRGQTNWSSGSIIGVTHPNGFATNNFRNPDITLAVYCIPEANFDQPDINGTATPLYWNSQTAPFTWSYCTATAISAGTNNVDAGRWAYHGKHSSTSRLSTLASTAKASGGLGWSSDVWDFTGDLPTLKNNPQ